MAIKLSGLISGMDTDTLVKELVSAYSVKKDNYVKQQTKLEWKMDAWKALNTKVYGFYTGKLSAMRFSTNFNKKAVKVSDDTKATITASSTAVNGDQTLEITKLAKTGYLTGAELKDADGKHYKSNAKLGTISGFTDGAITVTVDGKEKTINATSDMTISKFVSKLKEAGLTASYDENNGRFFLSAPSSGADHDFTLTGANSGGMEVLKSLGLNAEPTAAGTSNTTSTGAVRIAGENASIVLNGATFESSTNNFSINGLTITATGLTEEDEPITVTTSTDVDAVYDMVKDFITDYNTLIKEMDTLYSAASSKGYEPLTDDEKEAMSDTEVEKWEKKIKDSLLRRDSTLQSVTNVMKNMMSQAYEIDGKNYSLSSFGIKTLGYFSSGDNEKGVYHIDGDSKDDQVSGNEDKLKAAIANDPENFQTFFSKLANGVYDSLTKKMAASSLSSAYTLYNDKEMQRKYNDYDDTIEKWEDKVAAIEDRYYEQFAAMESALAELQASTSGISSLLGA